MIRCIVAGAAGRMGKAVVQAVLAAEDLELAAAFEQQGHPDVGRDAGAVAGAGQANSPIVAGVQEAIQAGAEVMIDFTAPEAALANAEAAAQSGLSMACGTTGFTDDQLERLKKAAATMPLVLAPNMSVGVNLLFQIVGQVARVLGDDFDLEIVEAHHRMKKDAPSGTAKRLAEKLAEATGRDLAQQGVYGREGMVGQRTSEEIGVLAVRAGDIVGEHTVIYGGVGERIEITHRAHSRATFAQGAARAARWVVGRPAGFYDMQDVLGLK